MALIYQTIRAKYVRRFLESGHYFIPCKDFSDKEEFRFGYCLWNYRDMSTDEMEKAVQQTRGNTTIDRWVNSTGISCWVSELKDEAKMWKTHGADGPAIRISIEEDAFLRQVHAAGHQTAAGRTIYGGIRSSVRPQSHVRWNLGEAEDAIYDLFFDKRPTFEWEAEFRVVLFAAAELFIPMAPEIQSVIASPLAPLDRELIESLREKFGKRFYESPNDFKAAERQLVALTLRRQTKITPKNARLLERLKTLEGEEKVDGLGWNDPKTSREKVDRMQKRGKEMSDLHREIARLQLVGAVAKDGCSRPVK